MDHLVERLRTPEECESFAKNAAARKRPDLALEARRRAVEMKASQHNAETPLETEALAAVYAYEALLTQQKGKKTKASRTWALIRRYGIIQAVEREMSRPTEAGDYETLLEMGMADLAFEALVVRHPGSFSAEALGTSTARLAEWSKN
ncbi:MAG TPA: hypothetical protein VJA26_08790 [Gammaproteobacteria bacterium]|nr:hypothetical protein [Gammaproteobacteria bacterium]